MNMRWLSGRASGAASDDVALDAHGEPIELSLADFVTAAGRRVAWIETNGRRTSDWLNTAGEELPLRAPQSIALAALEVEPLHATAKTPEEPFPAPDVLFVVPPPLPPNRHLRLHRRRVHVEVSIGDFLISGQAHVRPGAQVGDHIFRSGRRFVPLTDVELAHGGEPAFSWQVPCVIVNASHVTEVRGLEPARQAPTEPPLIAEPVPPAAAGGQQREAAPELAEADQPPGPGDPAESPVSRTAILLTALELLLAENVIDVVEFQTKRATLVRE